MKGARWSPRIRFPPPPPSIPEYHVSDRYQYNVCTYSKVCYKWFCKSWDIYCFFIGLGWLWMVLKSKRHLYFASKYISSLRLILYTFCRNFFLVDSYRLFFTKQFLIFVNFFVISATQTYMGGLFEKREFSPNYNKNVRKRHSKKFILKDCLKKC